MKSVKCIYNKKKNTCHLWMLPNICCASSYFLFSLFLKLFKRLLVLYLSLLNKMRIDLLLQTHEACYTVNILVRFEVWKYVLLFFVLFKIPHFLNHIKMKVMNFRWHIYARTMNDSWEYFTTLMPQKQNLG